MDEVIPKLAEGDKILEQSMKPSIARKVRSKHSVDPFLPRKPSTERPPVPLGKETPVVEGPSSEMPEAEGALAPVVVVEFE